MSTEKINDFYSNVKNYIEKFLYDEINDISNWRIWDGYVETPASFIPLEEFSSYRWLLDLSSYLDDEDSNIETALKEAIDDNIDYLYDEINEYI